MLPGFRCDVEADSEFRIKLKVGNNRWEQGVPVSGLLAKQRHRDQIHAVKNQIEL